MRRGAWIIVTFGAAFSATASSFFHPLPRLVWNASPSVPVGLYTVQSPGKLHVAELVVVRPTNTLAQFLADRRYLPKGATMLKRVVALPGQIVCRNARTITVDGIAMGDALDRDRQGRQLPTWQGCQHMAEDEVFLMNWQSKASFDGRYFGPLPMTSVIGRADPFWTGED